jgi:hypothetical protein
MSQWITLEELVLEKIELRESPEDVLKKFKIEYAEMYKRKDFKPLMKYIEDTYLKWYVRGFESWANSVMEQLKEQFDRKLEEIKSRE